MAQMQCILVEMLTVYVLELEILADEMREGIAFAKRHGAKVYVAANMVTHEGNEAGAGEWFL